MAGLRTQFIIPIGHWYSKFIVAKTTNYSTISTDWNLVNIDFTEKKYGVKILYDELDSALADMCFSNNLIIPSV